MSDTFELELEAMANGGNAMGWHEGRAIFVPYTIPGEIIAARITDDRGRVAHAEGVTLLDASADRVYPRCPHFGPKRCGGCQWQHMTYDAQLLIKQDVVGDQLERLAQLPDAHIKAVTPSPQQWGYLHHLTFSVTVDGELALPGVDDGTLIPIDTCHVLHPDLLTLYDELDLTFDGVQRVRLQQGSDGGQMVILTLSEDDAPELETDLPISINAILPDNEPMNLIGDSHSRFDVNGRTFRVTAGSFIRPNIAQLPNLVDTVVEMLDLSGGESVLDLYAGVGIYSAFIAPHAGLLTLVESYPPAVTDADDNLADFDHVDVIEGGVETVLPELDEKYDAAVVDPSGGSISDKAVEQIARRNVPRLVYISSDPARLARSVGKLAQHGYTFQHAHPLDPAPQTYYVETVALFTR